MKINLCNFGCYENKTFEFPNSGFLLITGKSGRGKSTIAKAIDFAITGKGSNVRRFNTKKGHVNLHLPSIKIHREALDRNSENKMIVNENIEGKQGQSYIYSIIPKNSTYYYSDNHTNNFLDMSNKEQLQCIENLAFNDLNITDIKGQLSNQRKEYRKSIDAYTIKLDTIKEFLENLNIPEKIELPIHLKRKTIPSKQEELTILIQKQERTKIYTRSLDRKETEIKIRNSRIDTIDGMLNDYSQMIDENDNIETTKHYLDQLRLISQYNIMKKEYEEKKTLHKKCIDEENEYYLTNIEIIQNKLQEYETNDYYSQEIERLTIIISLQEKLFNFNSSFEKLPEPNVKLEEEYNVLNEEFKSFSKIQEQSNDFFNCKCCNPPVPHFFNNNELEKCENDNINHKGIQTPNGRMSRRQIQQHVSNLHKKLQQLSFYLKKQDKEQGTRDFLKKQIKMTKKELLLKCENENLNENQNENLILQELTEEYNEFKRLSQEKKTLVSQHTKVNTKFDTLEQSITCLIKEIKTLKKQITIEYKFISNIEDEMNNTRSKIQILKSIQSHQEEKSKLLLDISHIEKDFYNRYYDFEYESFEQLSEKIKQCNDDIRILENYKIFQERYEQYFKYHQEIQDYEKKRADVYEEIKDISRFEELILDAEGLSIQEIIMLITDNMNEYLSLFFPDDEMSLFIDKKQNHDIKVCLTMNNNVVNVKTLSSGEKARVKLAFTLTLSEIFFCPILILDECTSALDRESANNIFKIIRDKETDRRLVIVIAHQVEKHLFDNVIDLDEENLIDNV